MKHTRAIPRTDKRLANGIAVLIAVLGIALMLVIGFTVPGHAATAHARPSALPVPAHTTASRAALNTTELVDGTNNDAAKYNTANGEWRLAAPGNGTNVSVATSNGGLYYIVTDLSTGDYMDWVGGGTGGTIHETSDSSLARAHWDLTECGHTSFYTYANDYAKSLGDSPDLQANGIGVGLTLGGSGCVSNDSIWALFAS